METRPTTPEKPTLVNVIAWMTLASGILNLGWGIVAALTVLSTLVGVICVPIAILPTFLGVFEIVFAARLLSNPPQPIRASTNIAVLEIVTILVGNVFALVVGILALVFYNDVTVRDYFARLNGMPVPPPAAHHAPGVSDPASPDVTDESQDGPA